MDEILKCDHSNESYRAVLFCGAVCYAGDKVKLALSLWMKSLTVTLNKNYQEVLFFGLLLIMVYLIK